MQDRVWLCISFARREGRPLEPRETKQQLRAETLARRDALDAQWRIEASLAMAGFGARIEFEPGAIVSGFWPIRSEVDIRPLMSVLREQGARLALPAILDRTTIVFRELVRGAPVVDTGFGTVGPGDGAEVLDPSILLVPLAAFDPHGQRIGYGAGHYDRAIDRLIAKGMRPRLIGAGFDCQLVSLVPHEDHDVPLDEILTESGLRRFPLPL